MQPNTDLCFHYVRKYKLIVVYDSFALRREDGTYLKVNGDEFNLGRDIDITTFTCGMLRNELNSHAAIPDDMDIEAKMCKDIKLKTRDDLVFPHGSNFEGQDIVLHIKVVEKTGMGMVSEVQSRAT